jgi:inorganic pyrophosphatase
MNFWEALDALVEKYALVIDRPRGSPHPMFPESIYPLDYGYLEGTNGGDGSGIDVWRGTLPVTTVVGAIFTVDPMKAETETKILVGCTDDEIDTVLRYHNTYAQKGLLVKRTG